MPNITEGFYVYALCDPRKPLNLNGMPFQPFYIGKGCGPRVFKHFRRGVYEAQYNPHKARKIASIRRHAGRDPAIVFIGYDLSEEDAFALEKQAVEQWGRMHQNPGGVLTNIKEGGRGGISYRALLPETRAKNAEARRGRPLAEETKAILREKATGRRHSAETCEKIRQIRLACKTPVSEETRKKLRELHKGKAKPRGFGEKVRQGKLGKSRPDNVKILSKQVSMYSMEGERLGTYANGREVQAITGVHYKAVSACCTGARRTCWFGERLVTFRYGQSESAEVLSAKAFLAAKRMPESNEITV